MGANDDVRALTGWDLLNKLGANVPRGLLNNLGLDIAFGFKLGNNLGEVIDTGLINPDNDR